MHEKLEKEVEEFKEYSERSASLLGVVQTDCAMFRADENADQA